MHGRRPFNGCGCDSRSGRGSMNTPDKNETFWKQSKYRSCNTLDTLYGNRRRVLEKGLVQGTTPGQTTRGRPRTSWLDNVEAWTGPDWHRRRLYERQRMEYRGGLRIFRNFLCSLFLLRKVKNEKWKMKKRPEDWEETQTLRAGCSKAETNIFAMLQTPFPGAQDGQNLISWRWSLYLHQQTLFGEDRCTQFRVIVVKEHTHTHTHKHTHKQTNPQQDRLQYTAPQLARSVKIGSLRKSCSLRIFIKRIIPVTDCMY